MTDREELARLISPFSWDEALMADADFEAMRTHTLKVADRLLAAGYRRCGQGCPEAERARDWQIQSEAIHESFASEAPLIGVGTPYEVFFLAFAMAGEVGELVNVLKKTWRGDCGIQDKLPQIKSEVADIASYLRHLCRVLGIDSDEAQREKVAELVERWPSRAIREFKP